MGEEPKGITFQPGAGQPVEVASGTEPAGGTPQYFTKQEAEQRFSQLQLELERKLQSLNDKAANRIENRVAAKLAEIERTAKLLGSTPEQVAKAKQDAVMQVLAEMPETGSPESSAVQPATAGKQEAGTSNPQAELANAGAAELEAEYGVRLESSDPEAAMLSGAASVTQWLRKYEAALQAKKQRLSISPQARIPSAMGGGVTPTEASMLAELETLLAHPKPENLKRIRELRAKLKR